MIRTYCLACDQPRPAMEEKYLQWSWNRFCWECYTSLSSHQVECLFRMTVVATVMGWLHEGEGVNWL